MEGMVRFAEHELMFPLERFIDAEMVIEKRVEVLRIRIEGGSKEPVKWDLSGSSVSLEYIEEALARAKGSDAEAALQLRKKLLVLETENERLIKENGRLKINREHLIAARDQLFALRESAFWENLHLAVKQRLSRARNELYKALLRG